MMIRQPCLSFIDLSGVPTVIKYEIDKESSPFRKWVGNKSAIRRLSRSLFTALGRTTHESSDSSFAILGPASTGKTTLARIYAKMLELPFIEIQPKAVTKVVEIVAKIANAIEGFDFELIDQKNEQDKVEEYENKYGFEILEGERDCDFLIPPCVVFIDEVHALPDKIVQGLLNALESKDRMLQTEPNGKRGSSWLVDCSKICWMVATTERGQLFGPFDSRFTKIQLDYYTRDEMAEIVHINNPDWDNKICKLVAKYAGYIPREALDFSKEMKAEKSMNEDDSWEEVALRIANDRGVDETGMPRKQLQVLTALGQGPISKSRLAVETRCGQEELEKYVLPMLISDLTGDPALVSVCTKGCFLTKEGLEYLNKRKIPNKGTAAILVDEVVPIEMPIPTKPITYLDIGSLPGGRNNFAPWCGYEGQKRYVALYFSQIEGRVQEVICNDGEVDFYLGNSSWEFFVGIIHGRTLQKYSIDLGWSISAKHWVIVDTKNNELYAVEKDVALRWIKLQREPLA